jgi:hypothetical protein
MRNKMEKLNKDTQYRITETDGKKWKGYYEGKTVLFGKECLKFLWKHCTISKALIRKIETVEETTVEQQARAEGRIEEYNKYASLYDGGKKRRTKFKYKIVFEMNKNKKGVLK